MLKIEDLHVEIEDKEILKGLSLEVKPGEIHAIMGPNGAGKSTLARVLAGDPSYEVKSGNISFMGKDVLDLEPDERAHLGLFMSFQYPMEISGISNFEFMMAAKNAHLKAQEKKILSEEDFKKLLLEKMDLMQVRFEFLERDINSGFSGGEKKRNEILQMSVLDPKLAILDETDSGLDIDAMKVVAKGITQYLSEDKAVVLITHYQRLLDYVKPDFVHVAIDGKIVKSGTIELAYALEEKGYDWLTKKTVGV
ncbi:Fe-S cluster assembly ATPase SufC [Candidatus Aerophobetes bacterium]|uniref:Fe-S cluster assembly ATPase SufC n=1 Tax=Aerophobetes bacterium TaxID=2030807 RepID=A0A2A4YK93_UNCAE|nr:MAG: Fe-S cluster assembly ATPase SufC [Candidatus Aerophobetes bacterium]